MAKLKWTWNPFSDQLDAIADLKETIPHVDLSDMPDIGGINTDHDTSYVRRDGTLDLTNTWNITQDILSSANIGCAELYNPSGDLKIMPDVQGGVYLFGDTDVPDDESSKAFIVNRRAAEGDTYLRLWVYHDRSAWIDSNWDIEIRSNLASGEIKLGTVPTNLVRLLGTTNSVGEPRGILNLPLKHYGYITAGAMSAQKYIQWQVDDADDWFHLTGQTASILGFKIEMPVDADGYDIKSSSLTIGANTLDTNEWAFLDGLDQSLSQADSPTFIDITVTSITIGANTLDTNEWAFLDGQNQSVFTTSSPSFDQLTLTTITAGQGLTSGIAFVGNKIAQATSAVFCHSSYKADAGSFALLQFSTGDTKINAKSGTSIFFSINNSGLEMALDGTNVKAYKTVIPNADNTLSLGTDALKWASVIVSDTGSYNLGSTIVNGTWQHIRNTNDLDFNVRETGTFNTKLKVMTTGARVNGLLWVGDYDNTNYTELGIDGTISFIGTSRINWAKISANGVTATGFTIAGQNVTDLQTANDGNVFIATEVTGGGNDLVVDFTGVTAFNWVKILGFYDGSVQHTVCVQIEITPFDGSAWDNYHAIFDKSSTNHIMENADFFIPDDTAYINSGVVKVRFLHSATTVNGHTLELDEVSLYQ